ncbi:MAG: 23S rRNA (uracil(1939)-C(5))-methyltransferase RlmD [Cytophagales bacterium]|nr:MAG: 23S rRNA (uracil(1939)-C(5))-methyltransferase RlmD [Cytophagales bacterium]
MKDYGKILDKIEILDIAAEGKCFAKYEGKVIFVENVAPGDIVDLKIIGRDKKFSLAIPEFFHSYSKDRIEPYCSHFGTCGGCKWQHIAYQTQLNYKQKQVQDALERIAKVSFPPLEPILGSEKTNFYRNKLDFTFSNKKWLPKSDIGVEQVTQNALGFHIPGSFDKILDIEKCYHQPDPSNQIRNAIRDFALANQFTFFDIKNANGLLRNLIIRTTSTGELMVIVQFFYDDENAIKKIMTFLKESFSITSLLYVINGKGNETFQDLELVTFSGKSFIMEEMEGLKFKIGPKSFYQTNPTQAYELYKITRQFAKIQKSDLVYDLYTGTGTIANFVAHQAKKVVGIEYVPTAIEDAKENAKINNITNTSFFAGDMSKILNDNFLSRNGKPDGIITDPPRAGMSGDVIETLLRIEAKRIVYVSCNPGTQARDIAILDQKYRIEAVKPVDMFPQTHHVENVISLVLK